MRCRLARSVAPGFDAFSVAACQMGVDVARDLLRQCLGRVGEAFNGTPEKLIAGLHQLVVGAAINIGTLRILRGRHARREVDGRHGGRRELVGDLRRYCARMLKLPQQAHILVEKVRRAHAGALAIAELLQLQRVEAARQFGEAERQVFEAHSWYLQVDQRGQYRALQRLEDGLGGNRPERNMAAACSIRPG